MAKINNNAKLELINMILEPARRRASERTTSAIMSGKKSKFPKYPKKEEEYIDGVYNHQFSVLNVYQDKYLGSENLKEKVIQSFSNKYKINNLNKLNDMINIIINVADKNRTLSSHKILDLMNGMNKLNLKDNNIDPKIINEFIKEIDHYDLYISSVSDLFEKFIIEKKLSPEILNQYCIMRTYKYRSPSSMHAVDIDHYLYFSKDNICFYDKQQPRLIMKKYKMHDTYYKEKPGRQSEDFQKISNEFKILKIEDLSYRDILLDCYAFLSLK